MFLLLLCYFISRAAFTIINSAYLPGLSITSFLELAFYGTRFDISAIMLTNLLYFFLVTLPIPLWQLPKWEKAMHWLFVILNATVFLFELSDWAYFPFNHKRATADVLDMVTRKGDFFSQLPTLIVDYWYVPIAWVVLVIVLNKANKWIRKRTPLVAPAIQSKRGVIGMQVLLMSLFAGILVLGIRGGAQLKPIVLTDAMKYSGNENVPVILNTPFSIISSLSNNELKEVHYMSLEEQKKYIEPIKQYHNNAGKRPNIVVIILESFSKEYTSLGSGKSFTPFLDSLMRISLNCTDAYANGLRSAEGIPAIIAGIPALMEEPITTSVYGTNKITALPGVLKAEGYQSAFYHGGTNGTMSFDLFCTNAGYDEYYGRSEYNNEKDYDGNWGIWDEPFLQYFAQGVSKMQQPFFATVFTLSSHPPYKLPKQYEGSIAKSNIAMEPVVRYADMSLRKFFATAAQQPWYANTLFVITADHTATMMQEPKNKGRHNKNMGLYAIPILFYAPGDSLLAGIHPKPVQQIDILPTILDYAGYEKPFFALGSSVLGESKGVVVNAVHGSYTYYRDGYLLVTNETRPKALYSYPTDSTYKTNLLSKKPGVVKENIAYLKAFIQVYNHALINDEMHLPVSGRQ